MSGSRPDELRSLDRYLTEAFNRFFAQEEAAEAADLSQAEASDELHGTCPPGNQGDEDLAAVREALKDLARGDLGVSFEEFDSEFRRCHDLPA